MAGFGWRGIFPFSVFCGLSSQVFAIIIHLPVIQPTTAVSEERIDSRDRESACRENLDTLQVLRARRKGDDPKFEENMGKMFSPRAFVSYDKPVGEDGERSEIDFYPAAPQSPDRRIEKKDGIDTLRARLSDPSLLNVSPIAHIWAIEKFGPFKDASGKTILQRSNPNIGNSRDVIKQEMIAEDEWQAAKENRKPEKDRKPSPLLQRYGRWLAYLTPMQGDPQLLVDQAVAFVTTHPNANILIQWLNTAEAERPIPQGELIGVIDDWFEFIHFKAKFHLNEIEIPNAEMPLTLPEDHEYVSLLSTPRTSIPDRQILSRIVDQFEFGTKSEVDKARDLLEEYFHTRLINRDEMTQLFWATSVNAKPIFEKIKSEIGPHEAKDFEFNVNRILNDFLKYMAANHIQAIRKNPGWK